MRGERGKLLSLGCSPAGVSAGSDKEELRSPSPILYPRLATVQCGGTNTASERYHKAVVHRP